MMDGKGSAIEALKDYIENTRKNVLMNLSKKI